MEIQAMSHLEPRLARLENDFEAFAKETRTSLQSIVTSISGISADIKAQNKEINENKPKAWNERLQEWVVLGAFLGILSAGVYFIADAKVSGALHAHDKAIDLLKYQRSEMLNEIRKLENEVQKRNWSTSSK